MPNPPTVLNPYTGYPTSGFDPKNLITGLGGFYRADQGITLSGANVTQWNDQSVFGRNLNTQSHLTWPTFNSTGFNSTYPAVMLGGPGGDTGIKTPGQNFQSTTVSAFGLVQLGQAGGSGGNDAYFALRAGGDVSDTGNSSFVATDGTVTGRENFGWAGLTLGTIGNGGNPFALTPGLIYLVGFTYDGAHANLVINGFNVGAATSVTATAGDATSASFWAIGHSGFRNCGAFACPFWGVTQKLLAYADWINIMAWANQNFGTSFAVPGQTLTSLQVPEHGSWSDYFSVSNNGGYVKNSNGTLKGLIAANTLRISDLGLFIEGGVTNQIFSSQAFSSSDWTRSGLSATDNVTASPDGHVTAALLTEDTSTGWHRAFANNVTGNGQVNWRSIYAKAGTRRYLVLSITDQLGNAYAVVYDLIGGTVTNTQTQNSPTGIANGMEQLANGWWRCSITEVTSSGSFTNRTAVMISNSATPTWTFDGTTSTLYPSYTGDGVSGLYVWGAQYEVAFFVSSYFPTPAGASATRSSDAVSFAGALKTLITGSGPATFVVDELDAPFNGFKRIVSDIDALPDILIHTTTNTGLQTNDVTGSFPLNATSAVAFDSATGARAGLAWDSSGRSLVGGGGTVATDSHSPSGATAPYLGSDSGSDVISGFIRRFTAWNSRLSDPILQAATSPGAAYTTGATFDINFTKQRQKVAVQSFLFSGAAQPQKRDFIDSAFNPVNLITGAGGFWTADKGRSLDAAGTHVTGWMDQSKFGNHLSSGVIGGGVAQANTPFNTSYPGVQSWPPTTAWIGTTKLLFPVTSTYSIFVLLQNLVTGGGNFGRYWSYFSTTSGNDYDPGNSMCQDNGTAGGPANMFASATSTGGTVTITNPVLLGFSCDGTTTSFYVNGSLLSSAAASATPLGNSGNNIFSLGALWQPPSGPAANDGNMVYAFAGITQKAMTAADWTNLKNFCNRNWGTSF